MKNLDLVILAGGKGSRIKNFLKNNPKPMMKFHKISFLQYLINNYSKYPIKNIYILTGYRSNQIHKKFHNKIYNFSKIICLREKKPMGTGGALNLLKNKDIKDFLLINGDTIFDINLISFFRSLKKSKLGSIALCSNKKNVNNYKLNNLSIYKNIIKYNKKSNLMNGGTYLFNKRILKLVPNRECSLEKDILPKIIKKKLITGRVFNNFFLDIGTPKYLKSSSNELKKIYMKPAVFLDRDGVINYDKGYVFKKKDFKFRKGVIKGLKYLIKKNYHLFVVTNQAGIAKGFYKEKDLENLHFFLKHYLLKKKILFDDVQYCPFHHKGKINKYKKRSSLRKPNNQMIKNIFKNWLIDKRKSFMIGDKISDKKCAHKSELKFYFAKDNFYEQVKKIIR